MGRDRKVIAAVGLTGTGKTSNFLRMMSMFRHGKVLIDDRQKEGKYASFPSIKMPLVGHLKESIRSSCTVTGNAKLRVTSSKGIYRFNDPNFSSLDLITKIEESYRRKDEKRFNGMLLLEDARAYLGKHEFPPLNTLMSEKRHIQLDILMTFYSLNRIPLYLVEQIDTIILHKTGDNINGDFKNRVSRPDLVTAGFREVESSHNPFYYKVIELRKVPISSDSV